MDEELRAEKAKEVLNNSLVKEAFSKLEDACIDLIKRTPVKGKEASIQQAQVIMVMQSQEAFKRHFESIIETGMLARDKNFGSR
jgi:hypothetical protein